MTRRPTLTVDRAAYLLWCDGIMLERDADGRVIIGDHVDHPRADALIARGGCAGLTVGGRVVSTLQRDRDGVVRERRR